LSKNQKCGWSKDVSLYTFESKKAATILLPVTLSNADQFLKFSHSGITSKFAIKSSLNIPWHIKVWLHYLVIYQCSKNCHAQELTEASCHAGFSAQDSWWKNSCTMMLALLNSLTKDMQSGHTTVWLTVCKCCDTEEKMLQQHAFTYDKWSACHW